MQEWNLTNMEKYLCFQVRTGEYDNKDREHRSSCDIRINGQWILL
jgi:hypothetical protein